MQDNIPTILPDELQIMLKRGDPVTVVDVREDEELAAGRIPGALHIPMVEIPRRFQHMDRSHKYVIVCRSGHRSGIVAEYLLAQGFRVINMEGGMLQWHGRLM